MQPPITIGRYQIVAELGRGGMATVYRAFDPLVRRDVAVKLLPGEFLHNPTFRTRFEQEARTIAALEHPAIVPVYDFGEDDGQPFLVMRLLTGGSLAERIHQAPLPLAEVARIIASLAPGLDHAHALGIIHRDLKPANILFDGFNNPHLSDFGLVKLIDADSGITGDSGMFGTPDYMAPEMMRKGQISRLVDIYSLGVTLFEMLVAQPPFEADTPAGLLMAHAVDPIPDLRAILPDLPDSAQMLVERAMAKNPADRYPTATEIATDLDAIVVTGKTEKLAILRRDRTPQLDEAEIARLARPRRLPLWQMLAGAGLAVAAVVAAVLLWSGPRADVAASATATHEPGQAGAATGAIVSPAAPSEAPTATVEANPLFLSRDRVRLIQPVRRLAGHTDRVNALAWSSVGLLASASADKTVILWDAAAGQPLATLSGHTNWVQALAFSPDGSKLISASSDHSAIIWDMATHEAVDTIKFPSYGLNGVGWSPDGLRLAFSPFYTNPILWSAQTGQMIRELKGHTQPVNGLAFSPDGA